MGNTENNFGIALTKELCIVCAKEMDGAIVMNTRLTPKNKKEVEDMHGKVTGFAEKPCEKCQSDMDKALMLIIFDESKSDFDNLPYGFHRTGQLLGIKKDSDLAEYLYEHQPNTKEKGFIFLPEETLEPFGLTEALKTLEENKSKNN